MILSELLMLMLCLTLMLFSLEGRADEENSQNFDLTLSDAAQQAVDNGVALTFIYEFANVQYFAFVPLVNELKQHRFVLTHHTLSNRYIVRQDELQTPRLFRSLAHAVDYMTEQAMELFTGYLDHEHQHHMRISLSKYELPGPMRLNAFISSEWDIDSGWIEWVSEK